MNTCWLSFTLGFFFILKIVLEPVISVVDRLSLGFMRVPLLNKFLVWTLIDDDSTSAILACLSSLLWSLLNESREFECLGLLALLYILVV